MAARKPDGNILPSLFLEENGQPMNFWLHKDCRYLRDNIEIGGGNVLFEDEPGALKIASPLYNGKCSNFISSKFIEDSINEGIVQNVRKYSLNNTTTTAKRSLRKRYTFMDDFKIVQYLENHPLLSVTGNALWQRMEEEKVTNHSWQSMKRHYKDFLQHKTKRDFLQLNSNGVKNEAERKCPDSRSVKEMPSKRRRKTTDNTIDKNSDNSLSIHDSSHDDIEDSTKSTSSDHDCLHDDMEENSGISSSTHDSSQNDMDDFDQHLMNIATNNTKVKQSKPQDVESLAKAKPYSHNHSREKEQDGRTSGNQVADSTDDSQDDTQDTNTKQKHAVKKSAAVDIMDTFFKVLELPCSQGLTLTKIIQTLYIANGSPETYQRYLTGQQTYVWTAEDDDTIFGDDEEKLDELIKERGIESVKSRLWYLKDRYTDDT